MIKFISVFIDEKLSPKHLLLNLSEVEKIKPSMHFVDDNEYAEGLYTRKETHTDFIMKHGEKITAIVEFEKVVDILAENDCLFDFTSNEEKEKQHLNITHPTNKRISFEWDGGFSVNIIETIHQPDGLPDQKIKGGFTIPSKNHDDAFAEIMRYIQENPNLD